MKPEEQRIAIAKYCGWKWHSRVKGSIKVWDNGLDYVFYDSDLPDYLNDLNAMHDAEKENDMHFNQKWVEAIVDIAVRESSFEFNRTEGWDWVLLVSRLTSAQRAEAFLRTIGKWTNNQPTEP